ncbi:MAG: hypothetical protein ACKO8I_12610 [Cyanobacteriota bacterium]
MSHRDPCRCAEDSVFDRLLAAQALADQLLLASTDPAFAQFEGVVTTG